jgi:hypothetical protein
MTNHEALRLEIDKQITAGFTADEIKSNLLSQQYTAEEVSAAMKQTNVAAKAKPSSGVGIISLLVSVYFIFNGIMKMNKYPSGSTIYIFGIVMLVAGIGGLIFKLVDMSRR